MGEKTQQAQPMAYYMPRIDAWIEARTVAEGRSITTALWRDWAAYVGDPDIKGLALGWRGRSMYNALKARGYSFRKSGQRYVLGISLRPVGELAPTAPAAADGPDTL